MAGFKYKFTKGSLSNQSSINGQQGGVSSYQQKLQRRQAMTQYCADYKMDIKPKGTERVLWMHKDEAEQL